MPETPRVVDDRVFLLGLDALYREAIWEHEAGELLACARAVAGKLGIPPADVPVEGYYGEAPELSEYFRLLRALQVTDESAASTVDALPEFGRLKQVTASPLFGSPAPDPVLLPQGIDALGRALEARSDWTVDTLTRRAHEFARDSGEFSLVALAAFARDPVVIAALRESVVLYARRIRLGGRVRETPRYVWKVDHELAERARRFIETFEALFGDRLPAPEAPSAAAYWGACRLDGLLGRCACLGDAPGFPPSFYHWGIRHLARDELAVHAFWADEIWTTERYRAAIGRSGRRTPPVDTRE